LIAKCWASSNGGAQPMHARKAIRALLRLLLMIPALSGGAYAGKWRPSSPEAMSVVARSRPRGARRWHGCIENGHDVAGIVERPRRSSASRAASPDQNHSARTLAELSRSAGRANRCRRPRCRTGAWHFAGPCRGARTASRVTGDGRGGQQLRRIGLSRAVVGRIAWCTSSTVCRGYGGAAAIFASSDGNGAGRGVILALRPAVEHQRGFDWRAPRHEQSMSEKCVRGPRARPAGAAPLGGDGNAAGGERPVDTRLRGAPRRPGLALASAASDFARAGGASVAARDCRGPAIRARLVPRA
jgi:hypothetical protein